MISNLKNPTKSELVKKIQSIKGNNFEIIEVLSRGDKSKVTQQFDKMISKGSFSIIFVRE